MSRSGPWDGELGVAQILWEDAYIIAINKPSGLLSDRTRDPNRDHAVAALGRFLSERDGEKPYLALHHRLDLGTSGVLLFARHKKANKGLSRAFKERLIDKTYRALVTSPNQQRVTDQWVVENHLRQKKVGGRHRQVAVKAGGDYAKTAFRFVRRAGKVIDIEADLHTGRRHQIRVHLEQSGLPVIGDERYGGVDHIGHRAMRRVMLHAHKLALPHPVTGDAVSIEAALPPSFTQFF